MKKLTLKKWDSAEHLTDDESIALYLQACFEEASDDAAFIAKALGNVARAKGMSQLARDTGLGRESLYKALSGEGKIAEKLAYLRKLDAEAKGKASK